MHRQHWVEQMRQANALGFGHQTKQRAVAVKAPGTALLDQFKALFIVAVKQLVGNLACRVLVSELQRFRAKPLHADHGYQRIGNDAAHGCVGLEEFELHGWLHHPEQKMRQFFCKRGRAPKWSQF